MSVDLRRFEYALEPVRRQRQWRLDSLRAELGRVQRRVEDAEGVLRALQEQYRVAVQHTAEHMAARLDPVRHPRVLRWLVLQRERIEAGAGCVETARRERARVQAECLNEQRRLELIEKHREECVALFAQEEESRLRRDADREWLVREAARRSGREALREERER